MTARSVMHQPNFLRFWLGQITATMGTQMLLIGLSWQVYLITESALALGIVGLARYLPQLLLTVHAGHLADQYDRYRIMLAARALLAVTIGGLVWANYTEIISEYLIYLACIGLGLARTYGMPAESAMVPRLVSKEHLTQAMTVTAAGREATTIIGPAIGGFIYIAGATTLYASSFVLSLISLAVLFGVNYPKNEQKKRNTGVKELLAGFTYVWKVKVILGSISLDMLAVLIGSVTALLPIIAHDVLQTDSAGLGLLRSAPAVGALAVSLLLTRYPVKRRSGVTLYLSVAIFGLATIAFGFSETLWLSLSALLIMGGADMVSVIIRSTLVQIETPDEMRGRVSAVNALFIASSNQLGEFESGVLAEFVGVVPAILFGGFGTLFIVGVWIKLFPDLWKRDQLVPDESRS